MLKIQNAIHPKELEIKNEIQLRIYIFTLISCRAYVPSKLCMDHLPCFHRLNIVKCSKAQQFIATFKIKTNKKSVLNISLLFDTLVALNPIKEAYFIPL